MACGYAFPSDTCPFPRIILFYHPLGVVRSCSVRLGIKHNRDEAYPASDCIWSHLPHPCGEGEQGQSHQFQETLMGRKNFMITGSISSCCQLIPFQTWACTFTHVLSLQLKVHLIKRIRSFSCHSPFGRFPSMSFHVILEQIPCYYQAWFLVFSIHPGFKWQILFFPAPLTLRKLLCHRLGHFHMRHPSYHPLMSHSGRVTHWLATRNGLHFPGYLMFVEASWPYITAARSCQHHHMNLVSFDILDSTRQASTRTPSHLRLF